MCATVHLHNQKLLSKKSFYASLIQLELCLALWKSLTIISFYTTMEQLDSHYICTSWFQGSTPAQSEIFARISFYTTLEQPDFYYIRTTWFHITTPAQPQNVVGDIVVHSTRTALISLHSYSLISRLCTYATWYLYLFC